MYSDYVAKSGLNSVYGRLSYDYDSRYLLEVSMRADASSKFGPGNQWGVFPAVSTGWVINREAFMEKASWIDNLKMRLSWGQTDLRMFRFFIPPVLYIQPVWRKFVCQVAGFTS